MMKKILIGILALVLSLGTLTACKGGEEDWDINSGTPVTISFWGWGETAEIGVYNELVAKFNAENKYNITVIYEPQPANFSSSAEVAMSGGDYAPDVLYVGDEKVKSWAELNFLHPLDEYVYDSDINKELDLDDIWETAIDRYKYDLETRTTTGAGAKLYAFPKDIGPTALYYNADQIKKAGITIVSKDIDDETITADEKFGYNIEKKIFNNRIAMTWDEIEALGKMLTKNYNTRVDTEYGYFTEWWFNYGWSVGGDCLQYDEVNNKYIFSLGDDKPNYRVKTDYEGTMTVGEAAYKAGEIIDYFDREKLTTEQKADCYVLPSQLDAFTRFTELSRTLGITPKPSSISSDGKINYFTSQKVAMLVEGRSMVPQIRTKIGSKFDWDVAPLPKHENGIEAGHSDSVGFGIFSGSKKKRAAFEFIQFMSGAVGQSAAAELGFSIPNQKSIANSDVFLNPKGENLPPRNSIIFVRAAGHQTVGDWSYLPDGTWIDQWAPTLNDDVRNGRKSLTEFFAAVTANTNKTLEGYTKK